MVSGIWHLPGYAGTLAGLAWGVNSTRLVPVLSLTVGIALAVALVSIADAILFRPLPVARPGEMARVYSASPLHSQGYVSYPDYQDFARGARMLTGIIAQAQILAAFGSRAGEPPEMHMGLAVTPNYFDVLGVAAQLGRTFQNDEARRPVAVLADSFWRGRYAGDRGIVGATVQLGGTPFTVIGIAPAGFGLDRFLHEDFYVPIEVYAAGLLPSTGQPLEERGRRYLSVYGRRRESIGAAQAELSSLAAHLEAEYPATNRRQKVVVMTELGARLAAAGNLQTVAWGLLALAVLSLTMACCNVGGLLLLRREARAGEIALKVALGASPRRLLRENFQETLALAVGGTAMAIPLSWAALKLASRLWVLPTDLPMAMDTRIDARMAAVAAGAALAAALLCAIAPAKTTRQIAALRSGNTNRALLNALVTGQVALAAALAGSGALLFAGMKSSGNADLGYRTDHILLATFDPSQTRTSEVRTRAFYRELLYRSRQLPGVRAAALAQSVPFGFTASQKQVKIASISVDPMGLWMNTVTPDYFELMRIPVVAGRGFAESDTERTPAVAVVNETIAQFWPDRRASGQTPLGQTPLGQTPLGQTMEIDGRKVEIVGVVRTAKYQQAGESPKPFFYLPYSQNFVARLTLHVLTQGPPAGAAPAVIAAAHALDPSQAVTEVRPLDQLLSQSAFFGARLGFGVTLAAGGCAGLMSLTGLYVCVASSVVRRRREIGIRSALGADRGAITRLVLAQGVQLTAAGIAIGLPLATGAHRWAWRVVSVGRSLDVRALVLAAAMVAAASLTACFVPAWRASRPDPAVTLRRR